MKIKLLFTLLIIILVQSCGWGMTDTQREFYAQPKGGLSGKEKDFIEDLEHSGYDNILIDKPNYFVDGKDSYSYFLTMDCPFNLTRSNSDSILRIADSLANVLYSDILSDTAIFTSYEISINLKIKKIEESNLSQPQWQSFPKLALEKQNGFKVIEISENEFKRIKR